MSGLTKPYKGLIRTKPLKGPERSADRIPFSGYPLRGFYLCLGILATRKRVYKFLYANLVRHFVLLQLVLYVRLYRFLVSAYRIHKILSCPKVPVPVLILHISIRLYFGANAILFSITQNCMHTDTVKCLCIFGLLLSR